MNRIAKFDSELVERLPLPLAQLYCRAHYAKMPLERHQSAFFLWEASVTLLASFALAESGELHDGNLLASRWGQSGSGIEGREWWNLLRTLSPRLAESSTGFRSLEAFLNQPITADLPRTAELDVLLQETQAERHNPQDGTSVRDLMDRIARYSQSQMACEALDQKENDYYEWVGWALLSGIAELLGRIGLVLTRPILFVADARKQSSGTWLIEQYELRGETPHRLESLLLPPELSSSKVPLPEQVYLASSIASDETQSFGDMRPLAPWLHFEPEGNEFFFLNGICRTGEVEHLCYTTGRLLRRLPVGNARHPLLDRMLGISGIAETANIGADKSLPDQPSFRLPLSPRNARRLGEFELVSCLGRGGMGVVYRAWHLPLKRQVGLKCMLRSGDPKSEARFAREIRALGRVDHPNLVKIYSSGTDGDQLFYAMELVEGTDLLTVCLQLRSTTGSNPKSADWDQAVCEACQATQGREQVLDTEQFGPGTTATMKIQIGPEGVQPARDASLPKPDFSPPADSKGGKPSLSHSRDYVNRVVDVIRQVAEAVHALHAANIVHRDIKPGNIMVTKDGKQAVLMDLADPSPFRQAVETDGGEPAWIQQVQQESPLEPIAPPRTFDRAIQFRARSFVLGFGSRGRIGVALVLRSIRHGTGRAEDWSGCDSPVRIVLPPDDGRGRPHRQVASIERFHHPEAQSHRQRSYGPGPKRGRPDGVGLVLISRPAGLGHAAQ